MPPAKFVKSQAPPFSSRFQTNAVLASTTSSHTAFVRPPESESQGGHSRRSNSYSSSPSARASTTDARSKDGDGGRRQAPEYVASRDIGSVSRAVAKGAGDGCCGSVKPGAESPARSMLIGGLGGGLGQWRGGGGKASCSSHRGSTGRVHAAPSAP